MNYYDTLINEKGDHKLLLEFVYSDKNEYPSGKILSYFLTDDSKDNTIEEFLRIINTANSNTASINCCGFNNMHINFYQIEEPAIDRPTRNFPILQWIPLEFILQSNMIVSETIKRGIALAMCDRDTSYSKYAIDIIENSVDSLILIAMENGNTTSLYEILSLLEIWKEVSKDIRRSNSEVDERLKYMGKGACIIKHYDPATKEFNYLVNKLYENITGLPNQSAITITYANALKKLLNN